MKVDNINTLISLNNNSSAVQNSVSAQRMFSSEFNEEEGLNVEITSADKDKDKIYTKESKDENGNPVFLTYRSKDDSLVSRRTVYSYGDTYVEYIKPGTNIVEKAETQNSDGKIIVQDVFYENAPFGIKKSSELNPETGEIIGETVYDNGNNQPVSKKFYEKNGLTEMKMYMGEPEEIVVYRKNGSLKEHTVPVKTDSGKRYETTVYRKDGTVYSKGLYADVYSSFVIEEQKFAKDGKSVISKQSQLENGSLVLERFNSKGQRTRQEIYNSINRKLQERSVYDSEGNVFIYTKYASNGKIIEYKKNMESGLNEKFNEKLLNGKIDTSFKQGYAGTCYLASTIKSLSTTEKGRKLLSETLFYNEQNGTVTVKLSGAKKEYTFAKDEIEKAMGRLGTGDPDFTAFLLGYEKYRAEEKHVIVDGAPVYEAINVLTGKENETNIMWGMCTPITDSVLNHLQEKMDSTDMMVTVATPQDSVDTELSSEEKALGLSNAHAYAVTKITKDSVYLVEPNKDKEIVLPRKQFLEKFETYAAADLSSD
ncbi:MAG: hypothetical protein KHX03_07185 [Clostridium sp.]|nr:hypothetical protein [Clostridium sp.]